jgi:citrate/tricarballylate utilization protein
MSADSFTSIAAAGRTSLDLLVGEASRQLSVCNACRYCEGLCAVFPALERRNLLTEGDVSQLANLCHDCRACYDACMYTAPHEWDINVPAALAQVRVADYRRLVWPSRVPRVMSGWAGLFCGALLATAVVFGIAVGHAGWSGLVASPDTAWSPYDLIPYWSLLVLLTAAAAYSVAVLAVAGWRYWRLVRGPGPRVTLGDAVRAVGYAATLRYLRGGGSECYYPDDERPSGARRRLHGLVAYGFGLCVVSTVSAGILQDIFDVQPPYSWLSVPVITGTAGGIGLVAGCGGLIALKVRSSAVTSFREMTVKDYGLLVALAFLALSGLATLLTRDTAAFGPVFLVHLAAVVLAFASAPYSKFVHLVFRFAALVQDNAERSAERG